MTLKKTSQNQEKGLTYSEKKKMFFFGFFIVLITGPRVFYSLPGNKKKKKDVKVAVGGCIAQTESKELLKKYPNSSRKDTCVSIIDELQGKLEKKAYENAMIYYKTENYHAASVTLKNILKEYPDIESREEILYYVVKSNYKLAKNSVNSKKVERFEETMKSYTKFVDNFPQSKKISELESIYKNAIRELNLIK